jgi:pimeloyl-ACP methyl ester carboxylesterase
MKKLVAIIVLSLTLSNATLANVVPCNEPKCNKKDHSTLTRFIEATEKNNKPILVWLSGGSGQYLSTQPLSGVEGKYDLVVMFNPYDISRNSQNRSDGYAPVAYKPDQADRIKSIIKFYKEKYQKDIWLGGQSFGAARTLAYLSASPDNSKLISGAILTGTAVGSYKNNVIKVPFRKIKDLNIPIAIIHHIRDVCDTSHFKTAKKVKEKIEKINSGKTEFISIEAGNIPKDTKCGGMGRS